MKSFEYVIKDVHGIHARPATDLFKMVKGYDCVVKVAKGDVEKTFKGLLAIMSLGAKQGDTVKFTFEGADEEKAAAEVEEFMKANL